MKSTLPARAAAWRAAAFAAVMFGCSHAAQAQGGPGIPADPSAMAAAPLTLDAALRAAPLDPGEFALAVGADKRLLPQDAPMPGPLTAVPAVAADFGLVSHRFGLVQAVASPTMTVLNANFNPPQIYDGMPTGDAAKLLAATLTPTQWSALTGPQGLAAADLTGPDQRSLFQACLPAQTLPVSAVAGGDKRTVDISTELSQARLRLGSKTSIALPTSPHSASGQGPAYSPGSYRLAPPNPADEAASSADVAEYGNVVKSVVVNKLKPGNLDFNAPALRVPIPLNDLKTVGDLVSRISARTKTELYADPHYAGRSVTVAANSAGPLPPAGDLLRALAFCLTATYRQVGPAYVLTDDLAGMAARRRRVADLTAAAHRLLQKPLDAAGDIIAAQHSMADLRPYEGGAELTPPPDEYGKDPQQQALSGAPGWMLKLPFSDLTPAQQAFARQYAAAHQGDYASAGGDYHPPSLDGPITVMTTPTLELIVPSVPGPIDLGGPDLFMLFHSPQAERTAQAAQEAARRTVDAANPDTASANSPAERPKVVPAPVVTAQPLPPPPLTQVFAGIPRRAVLVDARTPADVDAAVAAMKTVGFNQLWLPVFADGKARIPGTPFSAADGPDLLAEAQKTAQGTGISVYAVLDLLTWGPDAPAAAQDLTLQGDNSAQAVVRQYQTWGNDQPMTLSFAQKRLAVSPFAPSVRDGLTTLVRAVGQEPGVAGIVWRAAAPAGYVPEQDSGDLTLGYTVDGRLAFLRHAHIDPIDIGPSTADTRLPNWDAVTSDGAAAWKRFRAASDAALLQALRSAWAAPGVGPQARPVFVQRLGADWQADWFGAWDGLPAPLPAYENSGQQPAGQPAPSSDPLRQAKTQSKTALLRIRSGGASSPEWLASYLTDHLNPAKAPWDGFVVEFGGADEESADDPSGVKALQALADGVTRQATAQP